MGLLMPPSALVDCDNKRVLECKDSLEIKTIRPAQGSKPLTNGKQSCLRFDVLTFMFSRLKPCSRGRRVLIDVVRVFLQCQCTLKVGHEKI